MNWSPLPSCFFSGSSLCPFRRLISSRTFSIALKSIFIFLGFCFSIQGCAAVGVLDVPTYRSKGELMPSPVVEGSYAIHLNDGGVIITQIGYKIEQDSLLCKGERYSMERQAMGDQLWVVAAREVAGVGAIRGHMGGRRLPGTLLLAASWAALLALMVGVSSAMSSFR